MNSINAIEAKKSLTENQLFLLDVREPYEVEICNVGGLHIPMAEVCGRVDEIPKDIKIAVMCKSGKRASAVANLLVTDFHFENVVIVEGGIISWIELNNEPLEIY